MNRLRELRKKKGVTQKDVAQYMGISQNGYSYWERGEVKIDDRSLGKLAEYFGVTVDYILGRDADDTVQEDDELAEYLDELKNRKEMRMLFSLAKGATKKDVERIVKIIETLKE